MPPVPSALRLEALLRELPSLRRGESPRDEPARWATGFATLDRLLGGGFPRGRLCEIAGPPCSGRTSLVLALLAAVTRAGESAAVVDAADAFDPASAAAAQVDLERTLWVRAAGARSALRAADLLLRAGGFALVLLDLPGSQASGVSFLRLARAACAARATLVVVGESRTAGSHAELALEMRPVGPRFHGGPPGAPVLLAELESEAVAVRQRSGPEGSARLCFRAPEV